MLLVGRHLVVSLCGSVYHLLDRNQLRQVSELATVNVSLTGKASHPECRPDPLEYYCG